MFLFLLNCDCSGLFGGVKLLWALNKICKYT
jgi:hypothetical protein